MLMMLARAVVKKHNLTLDRTSMHARGFTEREFEGRCTDADDAVGKRDDDARPCGRELPPAGRWARDFAGKSS